jgi:general secretion pathway protein H
MSAFLSRPCARSGSQTDSYGLTLLELLVVVSIMAFATAGVSFALRDAPSAQLAREADRLAALLEAGRAASRASGVPVRWTATPEGFRFDGLAPQALPNNWLAAGISVQSAQPILLGPEPIIAAQAVVLSVREAPERTVRIASDGLRPFAVQ